MNEIASSHLARRTFAGNIYRQVKDPNLVASLTGHAEGSRAFNRYREIDLGMKQDLVKILENRKKRNDYICDMTEKELRPLLIRREWTEVSKA